MRWGKANKILCFILKQMLLQKKKGSKMDIGSTFKKIHIHLYFIATPYL